ncbi:MAG: ABC transporter ATP-binding protein [Proteobacteria bacterium]|nr:ABC transporter ATP-binding protein [Pseudomonadota bacterium]
MTLRVENLAFSFPQGGRSLADISFTLERGEVTCILGPNGAGKTTLIRCLLGGLAIHSGSVTFDGMSAREFGPRQFAARVAHVPQTTHSVFGHLVRDIVLMGRSAHLGMLQSPGAQDHQIANASLERVGISHLAERQFASISGGERQLCLLARALAQSATVLIMDEPAASLDFSNQIRILDIVASLARNGYAILMTTHHPDHALLVGTKVLGLREGRVFGIGSPRKLLTSDFLSDLYGAPVRILEEADGARACVPVLSNASQESQQHA